MSESTPSQPPPPDPSALRRGIPPSSFILHPSSFSLARAAHWGAELLTVFVGVYAAFLLNSYQVHRQERARREQILAWMEQRFTETVEDVEKERDSMKKASADFNQRLAAGEMPELHAFNFATDYDPADMASVLSSGGFDLLEVETVRELKDTESTLRVMLAVVRHDQQLSDETILPNLEKDRSFFYNPDTHQLRPAYRWYGDFYKSFLENYDTLLTQAKRLVAQIRAERQRNR